MTPAARIKSLLALCVLAVSPAYPAADYVDRPDVREFIESMRREHGFDTAYLQRIVGDAKREPAVIRLMGPPPSSAASPARSYARYRAQFLTPEVIDAGSRFWTEHAENLARAETQYGVPAEVILGILGVETRYGRNTGSFRVLD